MDKPTTPFVGQEIDGWCPRCRLNLDVVVSAIHEGEIKQVQCRTCLSFSPYKPPVDMDAKKGVMLKRLMKLQEKKRKGEAVAAPKPPDSPEVARWHKLTDDISSTAARPYDRHRTYSADGFVLHKKHGIGHVETASVDDMEMVVLFKEGLVTLPMAEPIDD